ncbi:MAG: STAS domain-containing protein [Chlorobiaceae bacterium]|nr:STAS domain-containing protein [Chlorobiaceae bacterium]
MKHSVSNRKELTILKLEEPVFDVRHAEWFRTTIDTMVSNDASKNIIIDFSQVKAIDSSGIGSMLIAHKLANSFDGLAIFVSLCQQIKDLLKLTNLDKQLFIFSSINEVMTLIEPALKGKRSRARNQPDHDESADEVADVIEALPDDVYDSESLPEMDDGPEEQDEPDRERDKDSDDSDDADESDEPPKARKSETAPKKRGRPKKNPPEVRKQSGSEA